jgi:ubiquinone/menaquinone biosynthesis C-methylase UbiE
MPTYWDRLAQTYAKIGEAEFWLKHRLRIAEGLSGRVLEVCCGGGRLVFELYQRDLNAYGIDLSPQMVTQAKNKLVQAGLDRARIARADVTHLPFADAAFDAVISTGAIALFKPEVQRAALSELARVARHEVRLLESFEQQKGLYGGRVMAFIFDGMRPIPPEIFYACGLTCPKVWDACGGAVSYIRCQKRLAD